MYLKQHRTKKTDNELPSDRTLFVANCNMGEQELKRVFQTFGDIEKIKLGEFASKKLGFPGKDTLSGLFQGPVGEKHARSLCAAGGWRIYSAPRPRGGKEPCRRRAGGA
jgi:hypothetical protein